MCTCAIECFVYEMKVLYVATMCALQCIVSADVCVHRLFWVPAECGHVNASGHFGCVLPNI